MADIKKATKATKSAEESAVPVAETVVKRAKKAKRVVHRGRAYVLATYNNTVVTLTDTSGNVLAQSSAGHLGFKGPKKSTPYAASLISKQAVEKSKPFQLQDVDVFVKGVGSGRESAVRGLYGAGLNILAIRDITPIPHNGCRRPRPRRV
jgi:small subunit ribosomal protein S11